MRVVAALCLFALLVISACGGKTALLLEASANGGEGSTVGGGPSAAGSGGRSGSSGGASNAGGNSFGGSSGASAGANAAGNVSFAGAGGETTDPCLTMDCNAPPKPSCDGASTLTTYASTGICSAGICSYESKNEPCPFGCANGACQPDPCAALTCQSPTAPTCKNANTLTTYASSGTCSAGMCSYPATDTACGSNQHCDPAAPACTVCKSNASCGAACTPCTGTTPECQDLGATSKCTGCVSNLDCGGTTPVCDTTKNKCVTGKSCIGLAATCGPTGTADCCASSAVTGGTFLRSNLPASPATVSDFRLDNYEITVSRFRKFVAVYSPTMIAAGAGKNANNPSDPGWSTAWNASLPANTAALLTSLACSPTASTWTNNESSAVNESRPINCLSWYLAEAFCTWDGGRLPTEAEWNYAAAGGSEQREYPWGSTLPDCSYANFRPNGTDCVSPAGVNRVGSEAPKGNGRYGQSDLAGNALEWAQDYYDSGPLILPCNDCAQLTSLASTRATRGGYFFDSAQGLRTSLRSGATPASRVFYIGARCARAAK